MSVVPPQMHVLLYVDAIVRSVAAGFVDAAKPGFARWRNNANKRFPGQGAKTIIIDQFGKYISQPRVQLGRPNDIGHFEGHADIFPFCGGLPYINRFRRPAV